MVEIFYIYTRVYMYEVTFWTFWFYVFVVCFLIPFEIVSWEVDHGDFSGILFGSRMTSHLGFLLFIGGCDFGTAFLSKMTPCK